MSQNKRMVVLRDQSGNLNIRETCSFMDVLKCCCYGCVTVLLHVVEGIIRESSAHRCGILLKQNLKVTG